MYIDQYEGNVNDKDSHSRSNWRVVKAKVELDKMGCSQTLLRWSQNALNLLKRFLSRFLSSFAGSSWASRGHLRSSAAPLLRGGRTRGALGHTRAHQGALISSLWRSSVHLAAVEVSLKFICYQTCNTFLDCKLYRNWAILHFMHSFPPVVHSTLKCVVYIWAHMPPK